MIVISFNRDDCFLTPQSDLNVCYNLIDLLHMTCFCLQHSGVNSSDTQVLTLYNVTEEESGEYICKVSNYIGEANQSAWLTIVRHEAQGNRPTQQQHIERSSARGC
jgi:hypothetical protein